MIHWLVARLNGVINCRGSHVLGPSHLTWLVCQPLETKCRDVRDLVHNPAPLVPQFNTQLCTTGIWPRNSLGALYKYFTCQYIISFS